MKPIIALAAAVALFAGCVPTTNPQSPGVEGEIFTDLPAAPGMKYEKGYGNKTPSGSLRSYEQEYSGGRSLESTRKWYEETFPGHGWVLASTEGTNPMTLTFTKKLEKVQVKLHSGDQLKVFVIVSGK
jgi:hypothetical protein